MDDGQDPVLLKLLDYGAVGSVCLFAPLVLRIVRVASPPRVGHNRGADPVQQRKGCSGSFWARQVTNNRLHRTAKGGESHISAQLLEVKTLEMKKNLEATSVTCWKE